MESNESVDARSSIPEVPVNIRTVLELNLTYQKLVTELIDKLETLLAENIAISAEADSILKEDVSNNPPSEEFSKYHSDYFYDKERRQAPSSQNSKLKKQLGFPDIAFMTVPKGIPLAPCKKLQKAVTEDVRRGVLASKSKMIGNLKDKLEKSESKPDQEILERKVESLQIEIAEIKRMGMLKLLDVYLDQHRVDWLRLATTLFNGRKSDEDLELLWRNLVWPMMKSQPWDEHVTSRLCELVNERKTWLEISKELNQGVYACWKKYLTETEVSRNLQVSNDVFLESYRRLRERDGVPWPLIWAETNCKAASEVKYHVQDLLHRESFGHTTWTWIEDIRLIIALYLYRGKQKMLYESVPTKCRSDIKRRFVRLFNYGGDMASVAQIFHDITSGADPGVLTQISSTIAVAKMTQIVLKFAARVQFACYLAEDRRLEIYNMAQEIKSICDRHMRYHGESPRAHERLDQEIRMLLESETDYGKPPTDAFVSISAVSADIVSKHIFKTEMEEIRMKGSREKTTKEVREVADNILKHGIFPPTVATFHLAETLLQRISDLSEVNPFDLKWLDECTKSSPELQAVEKHFAALLAFPLLMSSIEVPEIKPFMDTKLMTRKKMRTNIFEAKRKRKKPWIAQMWAKRKAAEMESGEPVAHEADMEEEEADDEQDMEVAGTSSQS